MYSFDGKTSFSVEGSRWRRLNPDGSYPSVSSQLGFSGTVDISELLATSKLAYRLNGTGAFTELTIDLTSAAVDDAAATVAELVTALNLDAGFSALFTASADTATSRLKIALTTPGTTLYLELKGDIAVALMFGAYNGAEKGFGTHFVDCFNNSGALGMPKEIKDFEEIEVENGDGSTLSMVASALLKGLNVSLALNDELWELKELIQGGSNDQTLTGVTNRYKPPTTGQVYLPGFAGEAYEAKYGKGSNLRSQMDGYKRINFQNCNGLEADLSSDVKTWAAYQFNIRVREYIEDGVRQPGYSEDFLTLAQFNALGISFG